MKGSLIKPNTFSALCDSSVKVLNRCTKFRVVANGVLPAADKNLRRAHPYVCPAGYWTIGYGHLCDPKHPPITEAEAEGYLAADLRAALNATLRYCPVLSTEPEERLAAIVDFTFNLGAGRLQTSTLRRRVNQRDRVGVVADRKR